MTRHYGAELQDMLDGRLSEPRRTEVEAHVATCERCRRELDALRWVKTQASTQVSNVEAPAELRDRVRASLSVQPQAPARSSWLPTRVSRRHALIAGAIAAVLLLVVLLRGHGPAPFPALVAADFAAHERGTLRLEFESSDPRAVEAYFTRSGVTIPTHVYDLGMMSYRLAGGRVHRLGGRTSTLFAYRGPGETELLCQMYEGNVRELPATDDVRQHNGFTFYVYRSDDVTMVFWQEDGIVCVLASDALTEDVVQLAFAKAMRVQ